MLSDESVALFQEFQKKTKEVVELSKLIETTLQAIRELDVLMSQRQSNPHIQSPYNDKKYFLHLCQFEDGSGATVHLSRGLGNEALLATIKMVLEQQLEEYISWSPALFRQTIE